MTMSLRAQREMLAKAGYGPAMAVRGASEADIRAMIEQCDAVHAEYSDEQFCVQCNKYHTGPTYPARHRTVYR